MKTCPKCSHQQENGNFCGKCGNSLEVVTENVNTNTIPKSDVENSTVDNTTQETTATLVEGAGTTQNEKIEKVKDISKNYVNTFVKQLKNPFDSVSLGYTSFANSIISILLFSIITALSIYTLINVKVKEYLESFGGFTDMFGMQDVSIPLFKTVVTISIVFLILIAITCLAVFITGKIFSNGASFKKVIEEMGAYYSVALVAAILNLIFALMGSITMVVVFTIVGLLIVLMLVPSFTIMNTLQKKTIRIDRFNAYLIYVLILLVLNYLVGSILYSSFVEEFIETIESLTSYWY